MSEEDFEDETPAADADDANEPVPEAPPEPEAANTDPEPGSADLPEGETVIPRNKSS